MSEIITTLHDKQDNTIDIYPNIKKENIPNNAIETAKINDSAVTRAKINDGAINTNKIDDGAITNDKIALATITNDKIANATITGSKIAVGTITDTNIATGTISTTKLDFNLFRYIFTLLDTTNSKELHFDIYSTTEVEYNLTDIFNLLKSFQTANTPLNYCEYGGVNIKSGLYSMGTNNIYWVEADGTNHNILIGELSIDEFYKYTII